MISNHLEREARAIPRIAPVEVGGDLRRGHRPMEAKPEGPMKAADLILGPARRLRRVCERGLALGALVVTLGAAVTFGPVITAGSGAEAQELDWATSAGGTSFDFGFGIATDPRGNSYVSGAFEGTATFGAGEANETVLTSAGGEDVFVAKYAPDGTLLWATSAGGTSFDFGFGIATDPRGNSYVTGSFVGKATFGAGEANETVLTSAGDEDVFVAKYAPDGTLLWATSAGGTDFDDGRGIATDRRGNSYVIGIFGGTATFGAGEDNETMLTSAGDEDVFVAKYRDRPRRRR